MTDRATQLTTEAVGAMPPPVGPGTQRYGARQPWLADRFKPGAGID